MLKNNINNERVIAFDLMRAVMLFLLLVFHSGISFMDSELNPELWGFKDSSTHIVFDGLLGFIHAFRHPAFFFISGFVTYQMFQKYSWKEVLKKRVNRLFIPMLITIVFMGPVVHVLFAKLMGKTDVYSLDVLYPTSPGNPYGLSTIYVWFIYYLFIFSLIHLIIERSGITSYLSRFKLGKNWFELSIAFLSFLVICALSVWRENSLFGDYHLNPALPSLGGYLSFYIFGIFIANQKEGLIKIEKYGLLFSIFGTVSFIVFLIQGFRVVEQAGNGMKFDPLLMISSGLATVFYSIGFLGLALKYYTKSNKIVSYISRSSYFLYLIHFPILLVVLKYFVQFDWNVFIKFLFVLIVTCIGSILLNVLWVKLWKNNPPI